MAVIGIDPGTALTGFGVIRESADGRLELVDYGVIETSAKETDAKRLQIIYSRLTETLSFYNINSCAVERLFFQKNAKTAISVGQARGVILLALEQAHLEIHEYNPVEIKQAVTGYGQASKKQIQEMIKVLLRLDHIPKPDDAADALAVAICHIHSRKLHMLQRGQQ
jgi:crossover junction endodeoxyribonuclease RuvC